MKIGFYKNRMYNLLYFYTILICVSTFTFLSLVNTPILSILVGSIMICGNFFIFRKKFVALQTSEDEKYENMR